MDTSRTSEQMDRKLKIDHDQVGGDSKPLIYLLKPNAFVSYIKANEITYFENLSCPCKNSVNSVYSVIYQKNTHV